MHADLLAQLKEKLPAADDAAELVAIAAGSGVSIHTLRKIVTGETADPRVSTVQSLMRYYLKRRPRQARAAAPGRRRTDRLFRSATER